VPSNPHTAGSTSRKPASIAGTADNGGNRGSGRAPGQVGGPGGRGGAGGANGPGGIGGQGGARGAGGAGGAGGLLGASTPTPAPTPGTNRHRLGSAPNIQSLTPGDPMVKLKDDAIGWRGRPLLTPIGAGTFRRVVRHRVPSELWSNGDARRRWVDATHPFIEGVGMPVVHPANTGSTYWSNRLTRCKPPPTRTTQ
jgi:hypothetical protein